MNPPIENVSIDSIVVGNRLRKDIGNLSSLVESIRDEGLLHPLTVDQDSNLIAGERRLRALREIGFDEVPVRRWFVVDDKHRQAIELAENIHRKDLTEIEKSRDVAKAAELAREVDADFRSNSERKGRPEQPGSVRRVAELTGIPQTNIVRAEKHVAAVDAYPFLSQDGWKQYHAMEAAELLDKLPEEERPVVAKMIDEPGTPPRIALGMLQTIASKPEPERKEIIQLAQSTDDRDRSLAKTIAAEVPPMPDSRLECIRQIRDWSKKAIKFYPNDPEVSDFQHVIETVDRIAHSIKERNSSNARSAAD